MRLVRLRVLLLSLALATTAVAQPTQEVRRPVVSQGTSMAAALSPDGTRLAIDLQGGLWTLPRAGGRATRITDDLHDARQPAWSPDGRRIAFESYRNGTWDIWTVAPDGSGAKALTSGPFDEREPHWSPDGRWIAFSSDRSGNYDIWLLELGSGALRQLTQDDGNDYWPAWSPDGREIAFVAARGPDSGIRAVALDGSERLLAASRDLLGAPAWTPDGRGVVYSAFASGATRLLLGGRVLASSEDVTPLRPQWSSPTSLIYTSDGLIRERRDVGFGADAAPGAPAVIPFQAELAVSRASYAPRRREFDGETPRRALGIVRPGLSPAGTEVVFSALGDVWTSGRGGAPRRITDAGADNVDPAWSPDGQRLAYASDREGSFDIYVRDLATGADRRLTTEPTAELRPTWSPDGSQIAFVSVSDLVHGRLQVVDVATRVARPLLDGRIGPISPGWSADGRTIYISVLRTYSSRYREGVNQVLAVPVDGGPTREITLLADVSTGKRGEGPAWSPDGRHVAFVVDGELQAMPLGPTGEPTGPARKLSAGAADQLSWSADSRQVLFSLNDRLMLAPLDGGPVREWPLELRYARRIPAGSLVVHAGRLLDGVGSAARTDVDILIARNRIVRVEPHAAGLHTGRVVDASNLTVMPGLIEAHGHYAQEYGGAFGRAHLAYGITSVRSPGGHPYASVAEREAVESGRRPGPRLFATGYLIDGSRGYYPIAAPTPSEAAIDREIERARLLELDFLKTYVRLPDALQRRAVLGAHRIGIPVSSHEVYPAAASGIDGVEHLSATSRRGYSPKVSLLGRVYEDVVAVVAASGMTITPTLALGSARREIAATPALRQEPRWQLLPAWVRAPFEAPRPGAPPPGVGVSSQRRETLFAYHEAGVPILAGTDSPIVPYGLSLHVELAEYVAAGLTPLEALRTATINTARALHVEGDLGTVEPGKLADLTIVAGDPLQDIRATRDVRIVIVGGVVHTLADLAEPYLR